MQLIRLDFEELIPSKAKFLEKFNEIINNFDLAIFSDYAKGTLLKVNELIKVCKHFNPTMVIKTSKN